MYAASLITADKTRDMLINKLTEHFATGKFLRMMMGSSHSPLKFCLIKRGHWSMQPARRDVCRS